VGSCVCEEVGFALVVERLPISSLGDTTRVEREEACWDDARLGVCGNWYVFSVWSHRKWSSWSSPGSEEVARDLLGAEVCESLRQFCCFLKTCAVLTLELLLASSRESVAAVELERHYGQTPENAYVRPGVPCISWLSRGSSQFVSFSAHVDTNCRSPPAPILYKQRPTKLYLSEVDSVPNMCAGLLLGRTNASKLVALVTDALYNF
jgi:hypothetical protein